MTLQQDTNWTAEATERTNYMPAANTEEDLQ